MIISINKDIEQYDHDVWKGLSARQLIYGIAAISAAAGIILFAYLVCYVPIQIAVYFGIPVGIVIALFGFLKVDDMSFMQYIQELWRLYGSEALVYVSEEDTTAEQEMLHEIRMKEKELERLLNGEKRLGRKARREKRFRKGERRNAGSRKQV